ITTRWTSAGSQRSLAEFFRCSVMPKTRGQMDWNCSEFRASVNEEVRTHALANSTRNRLRLCCRLKLTGQPGARWPVSPSGRAILSWPVTFGKVHWGIHNKATRLTNSWPFTTNTKPATQSGLGRSSGKHWMNFAARTSWTISPPVCIARSRRDLIVEWCGWNARVADRCWMSWVRSFRLNGEGDGGKKRLHHDAVHIKTKRDRATASKERLPCLASPCLISEH